MGLTQEMETSLPFHIFLLITAILKTCRNHQLQQVFSATSPHTTAWRTQMISPSHCKQALTFSK